MAKALPKNQEVAEQLELLADLLELEGEPSFRVIAYRRAATRIRETPGSVAQLALDGAAKELPGIGKTIEEKIVQIVDDGEMHALTKRKGMIPPEVVSFMHLPGLGPKSAAKIWKELGITTVADLRAAAEAEQLIRAEPENVVAWSVLREATRQTDPKRASEATAALRRLNPRTAP